MESVESCYASKRCVREEESHRRIILYSLRSHSILCPHHPPDNLHPLSTSFPRPSRRISHHPSRHSRKPTHHSHTHHVMSHTQHVTPAPITSCPTPSTSFPYPSHHSHTHHVVPAPSTSFPHTHHIIPAPSTSCPRAHYVIPTPITSFPRKRESPVLRPTTYSWRHPSPRKVTGCIRRMVGGRRVQIPAYAGMRDRGWGDDVVGCVNDRWRLG